MQTLFMPFSRGFSHDPLGMHTTPSNHLFRGIYMQPLGDSVQFPPCPFSEGFSCNPCGWHATLMQAPFRKVRHNAQVSPFSEGFACSSHVSPISEVGVLRMDRGSSFKNFLARNCMKCPDH